MNDSKILESVASYVRIFPSEVTYVRPLVKLIEEGGQVTSRKEFRGHVTAGAIIVRSDGSLLMVHNRALNRWLFPGGHLEPGDESTQAAAIREAVEETGVAGSSLSAARELPPDTPIQIDRHLIPANPRKAEPAHEHWDFRHVLGCEADVLRVQDEEIMGYRWVDASTLPPAVANRLEGVRRL